MGWDGIESMLSWNAAGPCMTNDDDGGGERLTRKGKYAKDERRIGRGTTTTGEYGMYVNIQPPVESDLSLSSSNYY